ncbi:hypothetical protein G8B22_08585 [Ligilactobacillus agilis]|uniref:hypothetical protein n=1 Tax=Ligilactobacillus agilis TaxID=1601 RepID=UPI001F57C205|nr:hypothetical protein [Ligilactobacillus agilis]UNL43185.1 hypothetical protein G8B22_08585 [Ligilactobacillus agilis]UNL57819.1 hypothetical protein G8B19_03135 [Ligilactobacillus agilis]
MKDKFNMLLQCYSLITTAAVASLILHGNSGAKATLRVSLKEVFIIFGLIVILTLLWSLAVFVAERIVDFFRLEMSNARLVASYSTKSKENKFKCDLNGDYYDALMLLAVAIKSISKATGEEANKIILDIPVAYKNLFRRKVGSADDSKA